MRERFIAKFTVNPKSGCWEWQANTTPNGYGLVKLDGRNQMAHRVAYELFVGPIPDGLEIDHLCRVRNCVNPEHLEPVTGRENKLRGLTVNAANAAKTHCIHGHEFTPANTGTDSRGRRECKACRRAKDGRLRESRRAAGWRKNKQGRPVPPTDPSHPEWAGVPARKLR